MRATFKRVYQFKIRLRDAKPPIWRRIQVPESFTFWELHVAIQDAMGWLDCHLHHFDLKNPITGIKTEIGIPDEEGYDDRVTLPGWKQNIADWFTRVGVSADYVYDYGDNWEHTLTLEEILPRTSGVKYPVCPDGGRACPPEDCGGTGGYTDFLEIIADPKNEEYEETLAWAGGAFDPKRFDKEEVVFCDAGERLKDLLR